MYDEMLSDVKNVKQITSAVISNMYVFGQTGKTRQKEHHWVRTLRSYKVIYFSFNIFVLFLQ